MSLKRNSTVRDSFDGPWKVYFRECLKDFLRFIDISAHNEVDWTREPVFLDKELFLISRGIKKSQVVVDCLVKVWLKSGDEKWVLIHIEFQTQKDTGFPERIFIYNTRAFDRYRTPIASYALLADDIAEWKPETFNYGFGKCQTQIDFAIMKLTDYRGREQELEASDNPFALAALTQMKTVETRGNAISRYEWKLRLTRSLLKSGWQRGRIEALYYFIDWMMRLPKELEVRFDGEIEREFQGDQSLELISPREKRNLVRERNQGKTEGKAEGKAEGLIFQAQSSVILTLTTRFSLISETLEARIRRISDLKNLEELLKAAVTIDTLDAFEEVLS